MTAHGVRVGDIYAGITGNRMEVISVQGAECTIRYTPDIYDEGPWDEDCARLEQSLNLVRRGPA